MDRATQFFWGKSIQLTTSLVKGWDMEMYLWEGLQSQSSGISKQTA